MSDTAPASGFRGLGRTDVVRTEELVPVDRHLEDVLDGLNPLEPIVLGLTDVLGLVLAEDLVAQEALPAFDNAAMDGYAVTASEVAGASADAPGRLRVIGEVAAGAGELLAVEPGTAVRIMTGAPLPPGADAVVPVEVTRAGADVVEILVAPRRGDHIRRAGEDVEPGRRVLRAGRRLRAGDVATMAALGHARVRCHPRPRVVIVSTGSELVPPDRPLEPGTLRDSNGMMLTALVRQADAVPFWAGIVPDDRRALLDAFDSNLGHADVLVTTGGVSAGAHDHVRDVLAMLGEVEVRKVAMKPGMPQVFGRVRGVPVFGLPGNPVSSFVSFEVFVRPAIRRLQGRRDLSRPSVRAVLAETVATPPGKRTYLRVRLRQEDGRWVATTTGGQGSHVVTSLIAADGLAEIPEDRTEVSAGEEVRVHLLVDG